MGVHKVSAFHPFIFQKSGKSTIIRNLAVPPHFVSYLVFFSSIRVDPGSYIATSPENTYPRGKHGGIKVHRSNACGHGCLGQFTLFINSFAVYSQGLGASEKKKKKKGAI